MATILHSRKYSQAEIAGLFDLPAGAFRARKLRFYRVSGAPIPAHHFDEGLTVDITLPADNRQHALRRIRRMFPDFKVTKINVSAPPQ